MCCDAAGRWKEMAEVKEEMGIHIHMEWKKIIH